MHTAVIAWMCRTGRSSLFLLAATWIWAGGAGATWALGDHGSSCAAATTLAAGERIVGHHDSADDRDVFKLAWSLDLPAECGVGGPVITVPSDSDVIVTQDIDEVDDDILEIRSIEPVRIRLDAEGAAVIGSLYRAASCDSRSQIVSGAFLNQGGLVVRLEPGTTFLRLTAYLEEAGDYELRIRTLPPLGR